MKRERSANAGRVREAQPPQFPPQGVRQTFRGLNNQRSNLRVCTHQENLRNRVVDRRNKLGLPGVWTEGGKYRACIKSGGKTIHLGTFNTPEEAAAAHAGAARALWGEFARAA